MKNKGLENSIKRTYLYVKSLAHRGQKAYNHCSNVPDIALTLRPVAGSEPMKDGYTGGGREGSAHTVGVITTVTPTALYISSRDRELQRLCSTTVAKSSPCPS